MFINAKPRYGSNDLETFVTIQQVDDLHQRLSEMSNNNIEAWSTFTPVTSSGEGWDHHVDEFNSDENFQNYAAGGSYAQNTSGPSALHHHGSTMPKTICTVVYHGPSQEETIGSQRACQESISRMHCFLEHDPMLRNDYHQENHTRGREGFSELLKGEKLPKRPQYQIPNDSESISFALNISSASTQPPSTDQCATGDCVDMIGATHAVYSSYSPTSTLTNPTPFTCVDLHTGSNLKRASWWHDVQPSNHSQYQKDLDTFAIDNVLTTYGPEQQHYCDAWNVDSNAWYSREAMYNTISPKALTLNVPPPPPSSSGSSQDILQMLHDSTATSSERDGTTDFSGSEILPIEQPTSLPQSRLALPDSMPASQRIVPVLPSNDCPSNKSSKTRTSKTKAINQSHRRPGTGYGGRISTSQTFTLKVEVATLRTAAQKRLEPKPESRIMNQPENSSASAAADLVTQHRDAKDEFLVRSKLAGMSYKDIRRQGKFTEAESTLRGRFRTLTKHKAARVRKPEWDDNDIRLLKKAVRKLTRGSDTSKGRIPWKQVAEYIASNGGSYHFGNATCRKRWDELQGRSDS